MRKALLMFAVLGLIAAPLAADATYEYDEEAGVLTITYEDPDANEVHIAGSFNNWPEPGDPLEEENGVWVYRMEVDPDERFEFKLQIDSEYYDEVEEYANEAQPGISFVDDGFGGYNVQVDIYELGDPDPDVEAPDAPFRESLSFGKYTHLKSETTFLTRDLATQEDFGYEATESRLVAKSYWKFDAEILPNVDTFVELQAFDGDITLYDMPGDASAEGQDLDPDVSVADGIENLGSMLFAPFYDLNDKSLPELGHFRVGFNHPWVGLSTGYRWTDSQETKTVYFNTFDGGVDAEDGFLEISTGDEVDALVAEMSLEALLGLTKRAGGHGVYSWATLGFMDDDYVVDLIYNAHAADEEQLRYFYYDATQTFGLGLDANLVPGIFTATGQVLATVDDPDDFDHQSLAYGLDSNLSVEEALDLNVDIDVQWAGDNVESLFGDDSDDEGAELKKGDFAADVAPSLWPAEFFELGINYGLTLDNEFDFDVPVEQTFNPYTNVELAPFLPVALDVGLFSNFEFVDDQFQDEWDVGTTLAFSDLTPMLTSLDLGYTFTEGAEDEGRAYAEAGLAGPADPIDDMTFNLGWDERNISFISRASIGDFSPNLGMLFRFEEDYEPHNVPFGAAVGTNWDTPWRGGTAFASYTFDFDPYAPEDDQGAVPFDDHIVENVGGDGQSVLRMGIQWDF